jgi:superfamily I DNA and/or RNA helicase
LGSGKRRINLDSDKDSKNFNKTDLSHIMLPGSYPLGRYPSNTQYALSFMQQVAVNLSTSVDPNSIRSVNGPPGTGKTTLLKDLFADLIVQQAKDICRLGQKELPRDLKGIIGVIPEVISDNGIVVVSSNNSAVQNIVNNVPLEKDIDKSLLPKLVKADYFREISNSTLSWEKNEETGKNEIVVTPNTSYDYWGLFSLEGGKKSNVNNILSTMNVVCSYLDEQYENDTSVYEAFVRKYKALISKRERYSQYIKLKADHDNLGIARSEVFKKLREKESEIDAFVNDNKDAVTSCKRCIERKELEIISNKEELDKATIELVNVESKKPKWFSRLFNRSSVIRYEKQHSDIKTLWDSLFLIDTELNEELISYRAKLSAIDTEIRNKKEELAQKKSQLNEIIRSLKTIDSRMNRLKTENPSIGLNDLDMTVNYENLQFSNPWFDEAYRIEQSELFILALQVRKQFLYENRKSIRAAVRIWWNQNDKDSKSIEAAWKWINMTIPVISSTFASVGIMFKNMGPKTLGHLFIDEAGQALPQAAVGSILRSKYVMAVGDPAQIPPVVTLDSRVLGIIRDLYSVDERLISASASVQTLIDATSQYGYYREPDQSEESWIGIPLWVHRRCKYPMFCISNKISYNNHMVQGNQSFGKIGWYNIKGKAQNKYVKEQGDFLVKKISDLINENPRIIDRNKDDVVYVISPFRNVAQQLAYELGKIGFTRYDTNGKPTNVGTIHTVQGKEAPIVFLVLGADKNCAGAAQWAMLESNMMNVAVTRAKDEFYIIGDKKLYLNLGCSVPNETFKIIEEYRKTHGELVVD